MSSECMPRWFPSTIPRLNWPNRLFSTLSETKVTYVTILVSPRNLVFVLTAFYARHILPTQLNGEPGSQAERSAFARPALPDLVHTSGGNLAYFRKSSAVRIFSFLVRSAKSPDFAQSLETLHSAPKTKKSSRRRIFGNKRDSLRWYEPDQVMRVERMRSSQPVIQAPRSVVLGVYAARKRLSRQKPGFLEKPG